MQTFTSLWKRFRPGQSPAKTQPIALRAGLASLVLLLSSLGAQAQLSGIKTIDPLGSGVNNYTTFSAAVSALNSGGNVTAAGGVTFNVAKTAFTEAAGVPAITVSGSPTAPIIFQENGLTPNNLADNPTITRTTGNTTFTDAVLAISGGDYITFDGISVAATTGLAANSVEFGFLIRNTAASGATNNIVRNARISLDRTITNTVGLLQSSSAATTTGAQGGGGVSVVAAGTNYNSANTYSGLVVENAYRGIHLLTASTVVYDVNTTVSGCTIGADIATVPGGDIGNNTSTVTAGIQAVRQGTLSIFNNTVRNVTLNGTTGYGISVEATFGTCNVYGNRIYDIRNTGTASTSLIYGLRLDVSTLAGSHSIRAYNNLVYGITHAFSGTASAVVRAVGIATNVTSSTVAGTSIGLYYNSVRMQNLPSYTASSVAFLQNLTTGPVLTLRNNIFADFSPAQTGVAKHYAINSETATQFGPATSTSNYNDLYVANAAAGQNGYVGLTGTTDRLTLADWQAAVTQDANSVSANPSFNSATDLHASSAAVNNAGTPAASITTVDIDGQTRSATTPDIGADEFTPVADDVAVLALTAPITPSTAGPKTVTVSIQNVGGGTLNTVTLQYVLNGGTAVSQTFTIAGGLASAQTTTLSFTTQATLQAGANTLVITGSLPNGNADPTAGNNSVTATVYTPLAGIYTINQSAAASPSNFVSFTAAATALNAIGISAAVRFNVLNGPYNEQFSLGAVAGTSPTDTIVVDGGASKQTLTYTGISTQPAAVLLNGTDYLTINRLTIDVAANATYGIGLLLVGQANFNRISNSVVRASLTSTSTTTAAIAISGGITSSTSAGSATDLRVENNTISGGYNAVIATGAAATVLTGIRVTGNTITDTYLYGIDLEYTDGATVTDNDVSRPTRTGFSTFAGAYFTGTTLNAYVARNRIHDPTAALNTSTSGTYGVYLTAADGTPGNGNQVVNNLIYNFNGAGVQYALYNSASDYALYYHNTISLDNTASTSTSVTYGLYQTGAADGVEFRNNIVSITRSGTANRVALFFATATSNITSNYNDLYIGTGSNFFTGSYSGALYPTLTDWKGVAGSIYDQNSVQADPRFVAGTLIPNSGILNGAGDPALLPVVAKDFANVTRNNPPDLGAYEFTPVTNDVAVLALTSPTPPFGAGSLPVSVTVQNVGGGTTTSVTLAYTYNGGAPVAQTFTGLTLASGQSTTLTFTTPVVLSPGIATIVVTATQPNGATDDDTSNNTLTANLRTALSGPYTINNLAAPSVTNFVSFTAAATALNQGGIVGPVQFNVLNGPYTEQISINEVAGASATDTIVFNGNGRTIRFGSTAIASKAVIQLNGADYVTIDNLVINANHTGATYGWGVHMTNAADNNRVSNCTIITGQSTTLANFNGIVASATINDPSSNGNNANGAKLENNTITGGAYGIILSGANATSPASASRITGNTVQDFYEYGILVEFQNGTLIKGNDISRPTRTSVTVFYGVYLTGSLNMDVESNRIHAPFTGNTASTSAAYGVYISASDGTAGNETDVVNNVISGFNGSGTEYGFYNSSSDYVRYYHNSVSLDNSSVTTTSATAGFFQTGIASGIEFVNNVVSVTRNPTGAGDKNALDFSTNTSSIFSNYNDLYLGTGTDFFTGSFGTLGFATLANWQTANSNSFDQNSLQVSPDFAAPLSGNLQPAAVALNGAGSTATLARVPRDVNNVLRNSPPDLGAYEFTPAATDLAPVTLASPLSSQTCFSAAEVVTVSVRNRGTAAINFATNPATVTVTVTKPDLSTQVFTGSITSGTLAVATSQNVTLTPTLNMSAAGTYTFAITAGVTGDGNLANNVLNPSPTVTVVAPVAGTLSPGAANICQSQTQVLTVTGAANGTTQFQRSTDNVTFTDITGATGATYTTASTTQTTYYRAQTRCGANVATSNVATITIDNPQPLSATAAAGSVCEGSTTTITVTKTAGQSIAKLYTTPTGGTSLTPTSVVGDTYTFTTAPLNAGTTNYYAAAQTGSQENVGRPAPTVTSSTIASTNYGLVFNAASAFILTSVVVYPTAAGNLVVQVQDNTGTPIPGLAATVAVPAGSGTTPFTVPLGFNVPSGTGLRLIAVSSPVMVRESSASGYPYTSPSGNVSITSGYISGTTLTTYYYFYNWQIGSQCEGTRVTVPVTATPAPAFAIAPGTPQTICRGSNVAVTATADSFYDTFTYTASPSGASAGISQPSTSSANATLTPTVTTTYTITSSSSTAGAGSCQGIRTLTVNVNVPVAGSISPVNGAVCLGSSRTLTLSAASGGTIQWEQSTTSTTTGFSDISGANGLTYAATPGTTTYYRARVSCGNASSQVFSSNVTTLTVNNPQPISTNSPLAVCYGSSGTLTVTGTAGQSFQFFANSTGGTALSSTQSGTTASFATPAVTANTTYYVQTSTSGSTVGPVTNTSVGAGGGFNPTVKYGMVFNVASPTVLSGVYVYPTVAGNSVITLETAATGGTVLATFTAAFTASDLNQKTFVPLNFTLPAQNGLVLFVNTSSTATLYRNTAGAVYPYVSGDSNVTITGNTFASGAAYYYYFYDWQLGQSNCTGTRMPLQVNLAPATTLSGTQNASGTYCALTITGDVTLTGPLTIGSSLTLANGATLNTNCQTVSGPGSFTMEAGSTLSICSPVGITASGATGPIQVAGARSFSNDANYIYNGTAAQVTGDGLPGTARTLTVNNATGLTLSQALSIRQVARLQSGNLATGGNAFVLISTVNGTALVDNTGGVVTGTGTMQRASNGLPGLAYRHYSAPVSNTTLADLTTTNFAPELSQAAAYNTSATPGTVTPFPNIFGYDETRVGTVVNNQPAFDKGWFAPLAASTPMSVNRGYTVRIPNSALVDFVGTFNNAAQSSGTLSRGIDPNAGWQLLGNPYPSPLDWSTVTGAQLPGMDNAMYVFQATGVYVGNYRSYVNGIGASPLINAGQGYFTRVTTPGGSGSVNLTNANRVTTFGPQPTFGRGTADTRSQLKLQVLGAGIEDEAYLYFEQGATAGVDVAYDAVKLANPSGLNLASRLGNQELAINGLPSLIGARDILVPLSLRAPQAGSFSFEVADLANFGSATVYLRDAATGREQQLSAGTRYAFTLATALAGDTRFALVFRPSGVTATHSAFEAGLVSVYPNPAHARFAVLLPPVAGQKVVQATLLNALGQTVQTRAIALTAAGATAEFDTRALAAGVYVLRLQAGQQLLTKRVVVE
jgi:hypothetical protein